MPSYELSDHVKGTITFSGLASTAPVLLVKIAIVRIEYADEEVSDSVVFDDAIMDARRWRSRKLMRLGAAALVDTHVRAAEASEEGGSAAGGVSASRRALDSWLPTEEDLAATELDPDLPVTGAWAVRVGGGEPHALFALTPYSTRHTPHPPHRRCHPQC